MQNMHTFWSRDAIGSDPPHQKIFLRFACAPRKICLIPPPIKKFLRDLKRVKIKPKNLALVQFTGAIFLPTIFFFSPTVRCCEEVRRTRIDVTSYKVTLRNECCKIAYGKSLGCWCVTAVIWYLIFSVELVHPFSPIIFIFRKCSINVNVTDLLRTNNKVHDSWH